MSLGVIEGVAEGGQQRCSRSLSGWMTDRTGQPKKLVLAGYGISSAVRPLIAIVTAWPQVLALRFTDRLGKGIRSSPRDAMLAGFAPGGTRGRVYGFHRAMDHAGAVVGPLIATVYLYFYPEAYRSLFTWTLVPGIIVIVLILKLPKDRVRTSDVGPRASSVGSSSARTSGLAPRTSDVGRRTSRSVASTAPWPSSSSSRSATRATRSSCCG